MLALRRAVHHTCSGRWALGVLGSLAAGTADAVSDVDAALLVDDGAFDDAWARRAELSGTDALAAWDQPDRDEPDRAVRVRRWLTADAVLVELLVAEADAGVRLSDPLVLLGGDGELLEDVERGGAVRSEVTVAPDADPEAAYDRLSATVRAWRHH